MRFVTGSVVLSVACLAACGRPEKEENAVAPAMKAPLVRELPPIDEFASRTKHETATFATG